MTCFGFGFRDFDRRLSAYCIECGLGPAPDAAQSLGVKLVGFAAALLQSGLEFCSSTERLFLRVREDFVCVAADECGLGAGFLEGGSGSSLSFAVQKFGFGLCFVRSSLCPSDEGLGLFLGRLASGVGFGLSSFDKLGRVGGGVAHLLVGHFDRGLAKLCEFRLCGIDDAFTFGVGVAQDPVCSVAGFCD